MEFVILQFFVIEKFTSAYSHQTAREIMLLLDNNLYEKASQKVKTKFCQRALFMHLCYNFTLVLHEKCTSFQPIRSA